MEETRNEMSAIPVAAPYDIRMTGLMLILPITALNNASKTESCTCIKRLKNPFMYTSFFSGYIQYRKMK